MSPLKANLGDIWTKSGQNLPFLRDRENPAYGIFFKNLGKKKSHKIHKIGKIKAIFGLGMTPLKDDKMAK